MVYNYQPLQALVAEAYQRIGALDMVLGEGAVIEAIGRAMEFMAVKKAMEERVTFLEVRDNKAPIPPYTRYIRQVARNHNWPQSGYIEVQKDPFTNATGEVRKVTWPSGGQQQQFLGETTTVNTVCPANVILPESTESDETLCDGVVLDCNGCPIKDVELAYYRPYFDLAYDYDGWTSHWFYNNSYTPVRPTTNTFFSSVICDQHEQNPIYASARDEYSVIRNALYFSFKEGSVAISRLCPVLDDETGYPMIPDIPEVKEAVVAFVRLMKAEKEYDESYGGQGGGALRAGQYKLDAQRDWQWYVGLAKTALKRMQMDERENHRHVHNHRMPKSGAGLNWFGTLTNEEVIRWGNTNANTFGGRAFTNNGGGTIIT